jgi:hypothetical protein
MLRTLRQVHFYLGVFFAPTIILFAFSGGLQLFSWHENHDGKPGIPWVAGLAELHKNQRVPNSWTGGDVPKPLVETPSSVPKALAPAPDEGDTRARPGAATVSSVPERVPEKAVAPNSAVRGGAAASATVETSAAAIPGPAQQKPAPSTAPKRRPKSVPLKVFAFIMAMGLIISSLLGVYMAFTYGRGAALIWGLLITGSAIPAVLLYF